jgi:Fe-S cluster assembly ATP-binding protein
MLQVAVLQPKIVMLDEIDSGLDIDALRQVAAALNAVRALHPDMAIVLVTHYQRILDYIKPDTVHLLRDGKIVQRGGAELVQQLELTGYADR